MYDNLSTVEFAKAIGQRPGMFFGNNISLTSLEFLLFGFDTNTKNKSVPPFFYFNFWAKQKLKKFGSIYNWKIAILETCNNDEKSAFNKFYELLDEFISLRPKRIAATFLTEDNFAIYFNKDNTHKNHKIIGTANQYILDPAPYGIKIIEFDYCTHSYHHDYYFAIGESNKSTYYQQFDSFDDCLNTYNKKYGKLEWHALPIENIDSEFKLLIENCDNR